MLAVDVYQPGQWHDFFVVVGGGAAALTGLVFVALSLNVDEITQHVTHRARAIDTLSGMAGVFITCALVLMGGQDHLAVGIEWLVIAAISIAVALRGYVRAFRRGGSTAELRPRRVILFVVLYVSQLIGAAVLVAGHIAGLYVAAVAMVAALAFMITAAWLLVVDARTREPKHPDLTP